MIGAERIERAIRRANGRGMPALAAFLTAGYPSPQRFPALLDSVAGAADIVEIGVPFSDPLADGVTIQRSSRVALAAGVTLAGILDHLAGRSCSSPVVLMSYLNPLLAFGIERLAGASADAGVAGFIVPDLPLEESGPLRRPLERAGLALIQLVTPITPGRRLREICEASRGFAYAVTGTGTTGGARPAGERLAGYLERVRAAARTPVLAGFGVRRADQLQALAAHADGAIVGSALIEAIERDEDPAAFLAGLRTTQTQRRVAR